MTTALVTGASRSRPRALVTGASAGLGRGYARALAADGFDLVLVARSAERLRQVAGEAESEFGIRAEVVPADLSNPEDIGRLVDLIGTRRIDVLINNAGYGLLEGLLDSDPADVAALDTVLQAAVRDLSLAAAAGMRERGRGGIITVSSLAALTTMGQYAASKASSLVFTEALAGELRDTPVTVTAVLPGFVHTEFHERLGARRPGPGWIWLSVDDVVRTSLRDARRGRVVSVPGAQYRLAAGLARFLPRGLIRRGSAGFAFDRQHGRDRGGESEDGQGLTVSTSEKFFGPE
ncbi:MULTISPECIES: SDR family NAD(P)-dependent oxidoreductase [Brevibacterium]|uniref:Short-chain dehydrogenase/reductase SDR n=2 Tax=Brevibacterium casei TaxID=33889 RepID=K9AHA6_9MICO|nr:SDR family NAD(P)-dependent oxidoreductase [Brevibacterium casei]NJE67593.1 SDR family NAD(P)-dependent oxidoreductase [Brevibacterium sp. LS14]SIG85666.1 oxidoreductase, short-chain dehydrogenase/reductase family [Mycobacteroides abscessus subsp. abscessus]EKU46669.1 short-chain dehydrogenase/reductase SDR [Brevibacterium casei S18]MBE4694433.1 SDR family NAD(P)-dependent oxidoreductase [Brevibacterium casei]MBY3577555.1 SDR family NAD(P)-dependent oxidoreductase [Brevibacterium casei]